MFTDAQKQSFEEDGFTHLPGAVPPPVVSDMYDRLWALLEQTADVRRDDPTTWLADYVSSGLQPLRKSDPAPSQSSALVTALDAVFGGKNWRDRPNWAQALVTFPKPGPWKLPNTIWHIDHPYRQPTEITGVNVFLFIEDVSPRCGGTLAIQSSPAIVRRFVSSVRDIQTQKHGDLNKQLMRSHPWLQGLVKRSPSDFDYIERYMERDTDVYGIPARVVELTGRAGDVILCHPWLVHAPSPNTSDQPRLMRALRANRRD